MKKYSVEIANAIKEYLKDWSSYSFNEEEGYFKFDYHVSGKIRKVLFIIHVNNHCVVVHSICPIAADPEDKKTMQRLAEFVCRANNGLKYGGFELSYRSGEIRFRSYIEGEEIPSETALSRSIVVAVSMYNRYGPGIANVLFSGMDPELAVRICEEPDSAAARCIAEEMQAEDIEDSDAIDQLEAELNALNENDEEEPDND